MTPQQTYEPSRCNYIFACRIGADGTFSLGPNGWTLEKMDTGLYRLVHNLGHQKYVVLPVIFGAYTATIVMTNFDDDSVTFSTTDNGQRADTAFTATLFSTI